MSHARKALKKVNRLTPHGLLGKTKLGKKLSGIDPVGRKLGMYGGASPMGPLGKRLFGGGGRKRPNPAAGMMAGMGSRGMFGIGQKLGLGASGAVTPPAEVPTAQTPLIPPKPPLV